MENPIDLYDNLFFSKELEYAIFQLKSGEVFSAKNNSLEKLDITKIVDSKNNSVRYFNYKDGKKSGELFIYRDMK